MAPFEPFDPPNRRQAYCKLQKALKDSKKPLQSNEPAIVTAYRETSASDECYPNSAELLKAMVGKDKLSGGVFGD